MKSMNKLKLLLIAGVFGMGINIHASKKCKIIFEPQKVNEENEENDLIDVLRRLIDDINNSTERQESEETIVWNVTRLQNETENQVNIREFIENMHDFGLSRMEQCELYGQLLYAYRFNINFSIRITR